jgi:hypothetical protein
VKTHDDRQELSETCSFISKIKYEKLVHLVGFIIRKQMINVLDITFFWYLVVCRSVEMYGGTSGDRK